MTTNAKPSSSYHHGNLAQALVIKGRELLHASSIEKVTIAVVAKQLNVSAAAVYRHFADRDAFIDALAESALQELLAVTQQQVQQHSDDLEQALVSSSLAYLQFAQHNPHAYALIHKLFVKSEQRHPRHPDDHGRFAPAIELTRALLASHNADISHAVNIAMGVWAIQHGMASLAIGKNLDLVSHNAQPELALELTLRALIKGLIS